MTDSERRQTHRETRVHELLETLRTPAAAPAPRTRLADDVMRSARQQHAARLTFQTIAALSRALIDATTMLVEVQSHRGQTYLTDSCES